MPGASKISLSRSTIYTRDHLIQLTDEDTGAGLITTAVLANDCLLAADANPMPLIQFYGPNSAAKLKQLYTWSGQLYPQPTVGSPLEVKSTTWQMQESTMEADPTRKTVFLPVTFDLSRAGDRALDEFRPEDMQKMMDHLNKELNDRKDSVLIGFYGAGLGELRKNLPLPPAPAAAPTDESPEQLDAEKPPAPSGAVD
jgi:hypothetical protein